MKIIDSYDQRTMQYLGSFDYTDEKIINYVASLPPYQSVRLVDFASDELVLTTMGNFLDYVGDKKWLEKILSKLIAKQTGEEPINAIQLFNRYEQENND
ncbi:hypothetical protein [Enterococcus faecium]|uniref:hypothetical protein n=1 Tax=Enterococcus faecium TaxID=1352 RepID=UPI00264B71A0|nr:hypothetical protein [Enterococcus faecium]MDN6949588.1 hypothetical protein [Enterococcus faecium]MDO7964258.1 hypothetical protein [Enterococcus faecium]MDO8006068.1 hypothetical protein [Enterococcus faecium]HAR8791307.1 hypothetical protein [Enterococcus faecium]